MGIDYSNVVVKKPWGYEYLSFDNGHCAIWILHIARGKKTSIHCHPNKDTRLIVLSGTVTCEVSGISKKMDVLDTVKIEKGKFHCTESDPGSSATSENGAFVMEIEWPSNKEDLLRLKDEYGRAGEGYEGTESMVNYSHDWLKLKIGKQKYLGLEFCIDSSASSFSFDLGDSLFLSIKKEQSTMKVSDYVADFIAACGVSHVFSVNGGGSMHLVDSIGNHKYLTYIATHHEQAAAMAAESYSRINGLGCALVTTGPGGTNALTGVACAWVDSIPVIYISGQVTRDTLSGGTRLRQFGIQETNIVELVKPITKYSVCITDVAEVQGELEYAVQIAKSGRPGPVWIDIPLDIQSKQMEVKKYHKPVSLELSSGDFLINTRKCIDLLSVAKRPVIICGNGVRLANAEKELRKLVFTLGVPVISSWTAKDIFDYRDENYIGSFGIFGDRASNFSVQNADFILVLGARLSIPQVGYNYKTFAREATIVMVDIDQSELDKPSLRADLKICGDVRVFLGRMDGLRRLGIDEWRKRCQEWKQKYPVCLPEYKDVKENVNSFYFIDELSKRLPNDAIVVTDMGTSFTCTMQAFKIKHGQRLTTASGHAPMGYGLPGAIGAHFASGKKVICIVGDGGLQMNIQELQTIAHHQLPIIIFVLNNGGYLTIKHTQQNHFGKFIGSTKESGLSCPGTMKIADAYGISSDQIRNTQELDTCLEWMLDEKGPMIIEVMMPEDQLLIPKLSSLKRPDGSIISKPLEDMYPFLPRDEFKGNMIVKPIEVLE